MAFHFETADFGGESEDQTTSILKKNKLVYLLPVFEEAVTNFDELITFDDEMLSDWFEEINSKFRNKFDKIRLKKAIKEHRKSNEASNSSSISPKQSINPSVQIDDINENINIIQIVTIDTETTQFCNELNHHIHKTTNAITNLEGSINQLSELQQSKHQYIHQKCNQMIKQINELKEKTLIPKMDKVCVSKLDILQQQINSFKSYLKLLNDAQQNVDKALRNTSLNNETRKQQILTPIKQSINHHLSFYPKTSSFIDVTFNTSQFTQTLESYWSISNNGKPFHERIQWLECGSGTTDILLTFEIPNTTKQILQSIDGYIIYYCDDEKEEISNYIEQRIDDATSPTSYSLMGLKESTIYKLLICSYNAFGKSQLSKVLTIKTNDKLTIKARIDQRKLKTQLHPMDQVQQLFTSLRSNLDLSDTLFNIFIRVDRKLFVPEKEKAVCNTRDAPLDLNYGVSLSAPHIHIHALKQFEYLFQDPYTDNGIKFLDVGCGSGYVASLLAVGILFNTNINKIDVRFKSFGCVYHPKLLKQAQNACKSMNLNNILSFHQSNTDPNDIGLMEHAPFDGIYCGAAITKHDANVLRQQLKIGGQLMCVVETSNHEQKMQLIKRITETGYQETKLFGVRFRTLKGRFIHLKSM